MGVSIEGIDELTVLIRQAGDRAAHGVVDQMRKEAKKMRDLARKMAPVDEHNLEKAIKMREVGGNRDRRGRFTRKSFEVYVDEFAEGTRAESVGEYAYLMHEYLTPFGPYKLGPKSRQKQAGQSEMVGGAFLERAADEVSEDMMNRLIDVARSYL